MPDTDQFKREKQKYIIFHGHIHLLPKESEDEYIEINKDN